LNRFDVIDPTLMPENGGMAGHCPLCPSKRGEAVAKSSFHNSIIGNFMVYQDRLETNLY